MSGRTVIPYPAIDLKEGACVRLHQGDMARATVYDADPADQARRFEAQGFPWLHVVDLEGAVAGRGVNREAVAAILDAVSIPIQLGGGIRDMAAVQHWLGRGVRRVVLGTAALRNPELVREACRHFPGQVAVAIDAREGHVAVEGWTALSEVAAVDLARRFEDAGVAALIHTDIERDGTGRGLNVAACAALARAVAVPVIASGGVASLADLEAVKAEADAGIEGVILGRALYDGRLDAAAALALLAA